MMQLTLFFLIFAANVLKLKHKDNPFGNQLGMF